MGSSRVKKPKQKKTVSAEQYTLFTDVMTSFAAVTTEKMLQLDERIKKLNEQAVNDLGLMSDTVREFSKRINVIEDGIKQQHYTVNVGQVSKEMLDNLKNNKPGPVTVSTPPPDNTTPPPEQFCAHTLIAVKHALRKMRGVEYTVGDSVFIVHVKCQGHWRTIKAEFFRGEAIISYVRRNGKYVEEKYARVSTIAASMSALCMYYATR